MGGWVGEKHAKAFFGYSGWVSGQLVGEIERGEWLVLEVEEEVRRELVWGEVEEGEELWGELIGVVE